MAAPHSPQSRSLTAAATTGPPGPDPVIDLPDSATFAAALADRRILCGDGGRRDGRAGARLLRLRRRHGLHAADRRGLRAAHRRRHHPAGRFPVRSTPFAIPEFRRCTWREVLPLSVAMAIDVPLGTWLLVVLDPIVLRWVHRRSGAQPRADPGVGLALSRRAARCRSPSASACSPASAPARCRSPGRR